jgi:drug/metabolite transporter (DMT)-like permease
MTPKAQGFWNGLAGVSMFAGSLPATRAAVASFDPYFVTSARAATAGLLAVAAAFWMGRETRPRREELAPLVGVALAVVLAFPLLTALALRSVPASHGVVAIGLLPLATAVFALIRGGEKPRRWWFWPVAALGCAVVVGFAVVEGGGHVSGEDGLLFLAAVLCGYGYAEGARLTRRMGGLAVISWALILSLPVAVGATAALWPASLSAPTSAYVGFAYVSAISMFVGFVFWYRGLALGGAAAVGQIQLVQPLIGLVFSALALGEPLRPGLFLVAGATVLCVAAARRAA